MKVLETRSKSLVEELMIRGYQSAAESMTVLIGQPVNMNNSCVEVTCTPTFITDHLNDLETKTLLVTELMGEIKGASYLVFTDEERKKVCSLCEERLIDGRQVPEEAILHEIDNILSASMITDFSNTLEVPVYGDVPKLYAADALKDYFKLDKDGVFYLCCESKFVLEQHITIRPKFIWRLEDKIINYLPAD